VNGDPIWEEIVSCRCSPERRKAVAFWSSSDEGRQLRLPRSGQMASVEVEELLGCLSGKGKPRAEESG
jgi:hypothetical protein